MRIRTKRKTIPPFSFFQQCAFYRLFLLQARQWTYIHLNDIIIGLAKLQYYEYFTSLYTEDVFLFSLHARQFQKCQKIWSIDIKDPVSFPSQRYHWRGIRKKLNLGQIWNSVLHFSLAKEIRSWSNIKFNFTFCISRYWYPDATGYYYHFYSLFYFYLYHRIVTFSHFTIITIVIT